MNEQIERIIRGKIDAERDRRKFPMAMAMAQLREEIGSGNSALPIALDGEASGEYEARAKLWTDVTKRSLSEAGFTWTKERAKDIRRLLDAELLVDSEELGELLRKQPSGRIAVRTDQLDAAMKRVSLELSAEMDLLVLAHNPGRVPLEEQLAAPRYGAVLSAWRNAHAKLEGAQPDYAIAVMDAVAAVEQLTRVVTDQPNATLGDAIKELRGSGRIQAPLLKGIEEIWGWASGTPGLRHGAAQTPAVDYSAARYIIAQSDAALALLISIDVA